MHAYKMCFLKMSWTNAADSPIGSAERTGVATGLEVVESPKPVSNSWLPTVEKHYSKYRGFMIQT